MPVRLVEVTRSGVVESVHRGDIAVVNSEGKMLYEVGDAGRLTFFRSSGKPVIAIAVLEAGIIEKYELDLKDIAIIASSHSGEREHIDILDGIMRKIGMTEEDLECGVAEPTGKEAAKELTASGGKPTKLHCNCSAKHMGIIAAAKIKGMNVEGYSNQAHPIQKEVEKIISDFSGVKVENIINGVDGCGVPVYAIPLMNMALSYANLCNGDFLGGKYRKSQNYVVSAMSMYPEMVGGKGRLDTELMKNFGDRVIGKFGAEGVYCIGLIGKGIGIALKIEDGSDRAVGPAILDLLLQMDVLKRDELEKMNEFWMPKILNHRGEAVGEMRAVFSIKK